MEGRAKIGRESFEPMLLLLILLIAVSTYFWGWVVLVGVAATVVSITLGTASYDKLYHATKCRYCNKIKAVLAEQRGVDIHRITTVHEVNYDDHMDIRIYVDGAKDILVDMDFNEEVLAWPELPMGSGVGRSVGR